MIIIVLLSIIVVAVGAVISWFAGLFDYSMKDAYQYVINTENSIIAEKLLTAKNSCETEKINVSYYTIKVNGCRQKVETMRKKLFLWLVPF